jgi:hypothetical protein
MCHLQRVPFAANLVLQQVPPPYNLESIQRAAQSLGLKAGVRQAGVTELRGLPLPCLAVLKPGASDSATPYSIKAGSASSQSEPAANDAGSPPPLMGEGRGEGEEAPPKHHRLALILKADATRVLLFDEKNKTPFESALADFETQFSGQVILFQAASKVAQEGDPMLQPKKKLGFSRSVSALLTHKQIWRVVLARLRSSRS